MLIRHPGSDAEVPVQPSWGPSTLGGDFLGWPPNYAEGVKTKLDLGKDELVITGLNPPLSIKYKDVEGIEMVPSKQMTTSRIIAVGPDLAASWKKMEYFLCIRYRDDVGIQMSLMFSPWPEEPLEEFVRALYQNLRDARRRGSAAAPLTDHVGTE